MSESFDLDAVLAQVDAGLDASLERLFGLLRIASVSADPAHAGDCVAAADWLQQELTELGFTAKNHKTAGQPIVFASNLQAGAPHVLFYGHYDVQPADPLELWDGDPFEPTILTDPQGHKIIRARGASDDKGQLMTFLEACRAFREVTGALPLGVSVLIEGEEESGGQSLPVFLEEHQTALAADALLICDTDMWDRQTPAITAMLRGVVAEEVQIRCASRDLHSGLYGSAAYNANQVLATIIASFRNEDGRVAIAGFYDALRPLAPEIASNWQNLGFDGTAFLADAGLSAPAGENDRSVLEQIWSRPTCEINGIWGGYTGEGFKTVIPAAASAKISFRLVADQDPEKIRAAFRQHVTARLPEGCTTSFKSHGASRAIAVETSSISFQRVSAALGEEWGRPTAIVGSGGSIPIVETFKSQLDLDAIMVGFAHASDNIHSPNEKYDLQSFHKGIRSFVRVLAALAEKTDK